MYDSLLAHAFVGIWERVQGEVSKVMLTSAIRLPESGIRIDPWIGY